ncbi:MAG: ABC transporter ATP-binding protein [Clostridia bacterium]|nr:ABC transporter ATP-binding protein [Clostridia bacterium]
MRDGTENGSSDVKTASKNKRGDLPEKGTGAISRALKALGGFFYRLFYVVLLVWETKPLILFAMVFMSVFNGVMPILSAFISASLINALVEGITGAGDGFGNVIGLLVLQFGYIILSNMVKKINQAINRTSNELVANHIKTKIIKKAKTLDLRDFDLPDFYSKLENANKEAGYRPLNSLASTFSMFSTIISIVSFIVIISAVSVWAPIIIIAISLPSAAVNFIYKKKDASFMRKNSKQRRQMDYYSQLIVNKDLVKEVRIYGLADLLIDKFSRTFRKYYTGLKKLVLQETFWHLGLSVISSVANCLIFLYIAQKTYYGELQLGDYSLYTGALNSISTGVATFISTTATIYEGALFIENLIAFMKEETTIVPSVDEPAQPSSGDHTIEFVNVSFRYPGTERFVIKNVSFKLSPGETCVLVGLNGAGKTTLIKLLTRLYDPTEGVILLDGRDIREYDVARLYSLFGIIFQDFGKYAFRVDENIAFGGISKGIVDADVRTSAEKSGASGFIEDLPKGYETPLMRLFEDDGIELSGGQWQKLSIARSFYGDADILILDEPTAALDPMAEQAVFDKFDSLSRDKLTIFVSHRLSSATSASKILVLESGMLVEEGTHTELMDKKGKYYTLFTTQAKRYMENGAAKETAGA